MKKAFAIKFSFCVFALLATQELQAAPYIYSHTSKTATSVTSQLLGARTYNVEGQLVSEGDAAGKLTSYTYNSTGQLITTEDRDGNDIHNTYNPHGQLQTSWADHNASSTAPGANATDLLTPQYDSGDDRLTESTYQQNQSAAKEITGDHYNLAGELSVKSYGSSSKPLTQQYQYNLNGSVKSFTNVLNQTTNYTYTPMNQLYTVVFNGGTTTYTYDEFGRKSNETRPNGVQTNWTYDDYNGVKTMVSGNDAQLGYTYYADGNIHTETVSPGTTYTYQYNNLNQLQNFGCTGTECPKDSHGNTISSNAYTYTLNNGTQTITTKNTKGEINTATYNYYPSYPDRLKNITNSDNNLNQAGTYIYDNNGNVTTDAKGDTLSYDALNQMLTLKNSQGAATRYGYDGNGKMNQETPAGQTPINEYYGGNGKIVTAKIQGTAATTYAMGLDRIAQYYYADTTKPATSTQYYLYDQRGSVTNVLGSSSNIGYVYSPFGYLSTTGSTKKQSTTGLNNNTFGYIGQSLDPATGLMMMGGYRAYNPAVGNFLKQDSYSPFQGADTFNGYDYGAGNPVLFIDPTGHMPWWGWMAIAAGIVVGAALTGGALAAASGIVTSAGLAGASAAAVTVSGGVLGSAVGSAVGVVTTDGIDDKIEHKGFSAAQWRSVGIAAGIGAAVGLLAGGAVTAIAARRAANAADDAAVAADDAAVAADNAAAAADTDRPDDQLSASALRTKKGIQGINFSERPGGELPQVSSSSDPGTSSRVFEGRGVSSSPAEETFARDARENAASYLGSDGRPNPYAMWWTDGDLRVMQEDMGFSRQYNELRGLRNL